MSDSLNQLSEFFAQYPHASGILKSLIIAILCFPLLWMVAGLASGIVKRNANDHVALLIKKLIIYTGSIILVATILVELGFNLSAILGAAGIVSVAVGFAAQTSLSNIISGVFLYWEKPFQVGDVIRIGTTTGIVISIDLLSVKLRSFENQMIRIPNETLIKAESTNVTRFPIRRLTLPVSVSYGSDVQQVMNALREIADQNPYCLDEPEPLIVFDKFGESSLDFIFGPWVEKSEFLALKNSIMRDIKNHFDAKGIEIPFPQRVLHIQSQGSDAPPTPPI